MTLQKLIELLSSLCNEETKDLKVTYGCDGEFYRVTEIWRRKQKNDYIEVDEIRIM